MKKITIIICLSLLCTGCIPKSYIEKLGIITAVGYDLVEDSKLEGTLVVFQFDPTSSNTSQIITSKAETSKGIRYQANRLTSHRLVSGQVRLALYQDKLAEKGMLKYMDTLARDAKISDLGYLAVSNVPTSELMKSNLSEDAPNIGIYLQSLIEKSIKNQMIPDSLINIFLRDVHDLGIDPVLPMLSLNDDKPYIHGLSLFQDDKYVSMLDEKDIFHLMLMRQRSEDTEFQLDLPSESLKEYYKTENSNMNDGTLHVSLNDLRNRTSFEFIDGDFTNPKVKIKMEGRLMEITKDIDLKDQAIKALEKELEKQLTDRLEQLVDKLKEKNVDPVGFGKKFNERHRKNQLTEEAWRSQIPELDVTFDIEIKLLRHGITE
ncbi:Ger(x)C family spore germination protein [Halobacillus locisalis]|uniref:Ger(X)C family spore germination protein n=1 Tax=Halobacillus locisalis TaxID=220753 RepID=A0A838CS03_9BACI|nr:Ger(x)C family spore germination protein [Halobacillus locisalis]MBA2174643.1 Ger(x)C family spore germination protein [Halobacillus locisalis]